MPPQAPDNTCVTDDDAIDFACFYVRHPAHAGFRAAGSALAPTAAGETDLPVHAGR
jgi:hypothetical protein